MPPQVWRPLGAGAGLPASRPALAVQEEAVITAAANSLMTALLGLFAFEPQLPGSLG